MALVRHGAVGTHHPRRHRRLREEGDRLGVEFAGGTSVIAQFDRPVSVEQVRTRWGTLSWRRQNTVVAEFGDPSQHRVMIRVPQAGEEQAPR
jgi:preprotein translocase subunit SecF